MTTLIGVAGGSASGKSTIVDDLAAYFKDNLTVIYQDNYYKAHGDLSFQERTQLNYDHPDAFDTKLMIAHLQALKHGHAIIMPTYDFKCHNRAEKTVLVSPTPVILVEGILVLENAALRSLFDIKIFVDTDSDVRLMRRILRDVGERDRSVESVLEQYMATVKPMHEAFIEPSKKYADIIIPHGGHNKIALSMLIRQIAALMDA